MHNVVGSGIHCGFRPINGNCYRNYTRGRDYSFSISVSFVPMDYTRKPIKTRSMMIGKGLWH